MILKQTYETKMTPNEIDSWIRIKKNEKVGLFKISRFAAKSNESGFMIREKRFNKYQSFMPRVIGKYTFSINSTKIDLLILPSFTGLLFFSAFLIVFPLVIFCSDYINLNGTLTSDLSDRVKMSGIVLIIVLPIMFWALIRPLYKARTWIETELRLNRTE